MKQEEYLLQVACVTWFRLQYPKFTKLLFSIPNSNDMSAHNRQAAIFTMSKLKKSGLQSGVSDLFLAIANKNHNGLFIEMKSEKGKISTEQIKFRDAVTSQNYLFKLINSFENFRKLITDYLGNTI